MLNFLPRTGKAFWATRLVVDPETSHSQSGLEGKGLAIDVAVTSPLAPSSLRLAEPCEWYAATKKHAKYDLSFESTNFIFSTMVFETLGAINVEGGKEVLRRLFRFAAKRTGREFTSYCGRAWARFSCNLQRSVSQAILTRIDGREFCAGSTILYIETAAHFLPAVTPLFFSL